MSCITENENFSAVCTNSAFIKTAFIQYLENEHPIDDEPPNEYVYNMHLFMITWLCNNVFEHENDVYTICFGLHGVTSLLPILAFVCDSFKT